MYRLAVSNKLQRQQSTDLKLSFEKIFHQNQRLQESPLFQHIYTQFHQTKALGVHMGLWLFEFANFSFAGR